VLDDFFVINGVSHAYNLLPENIQPNRWAEGLRDLLLALHIGWNPPGVSMSESDQQTDWTIDTLARSLFLETDVDLAVTHTLRLDSYMKDGLCRREKTVEACTKYPDRFMGYVGVDPTDGLEVCLRELDEQMAELPQAVGLKMYPSQVDPYASWRMDDPKLAFPLFERAMQHGLKIIAIHKAAPLGPVPMNPYRIDDVEGAALEFPDLNFLIIHGGLAFVNETAQALGRYPNVYADFEITASYLVKAPVLFEKVMAEFMLWGGSEKLIYSDGHSVFHSQPILERFRDFQFSEETQVGYGVAPLSHADKANILGKNYARIIGLDIEAAKAKIANDQFAQERAKTGLQAPYSNWKRELEMSSAVGVSS
jgi:Predicted metal-dependent hydrolase of the TIM-barrel fold